RALRRSYIPKSRGLVIAAGKNNFRFACHLIVSLRNIHNSTIPIEVAYAGEDDLPIQFRKVLKSLGTDVETLDVTAVFDDATLDLQHGHEGWAIKPFATLASRFEQVILLDADAVFLQSPEVLFQHSGYLETGTLLFHDRLLAKGGYPARKTFWEKQME